MEETAEKIQWHPAFYAGIQIEFEEEAQKLSFENEHNLSTKPLQVDVLIIKKHIGETIKKNIGQIFRECNIFEYKSPTDYLSIDDYYKVYAYTCLYKADTRKSDEIKIEDVTMSLVSRHYPRNLINHLKKQRNLKIEKFAKGIYYIIGEAFPIQIIVTKKLSKKENFWLKNLTNDLTRKEAEQLIYEYEGHKQNILYQSIMDVIVRANENDFREVNCMCNALLEIVKDELADELKEREALAISQGLTQGLTQGLAQGLVQGVVQGKQEQLSSMITKKIAKGKSLEQIADELEETVDEILPLYQQILTKLQDA